jgi:hypothetical protein
VDELHQLRRGFVRERFVAVGQHDAGGAARHEAVDQYLEPPQGRRRGQHEVPVGEDAGLAHVQQRDLLAVGQRGLQRPGRDGRVADALRRREPPEGAAVRALEDHAPVERFERPTVEMQVAPVLAADEFDGVHVGGRQHHGRAGADIDDALLHQRVARRIAGLLTAIEHVALAAFDAGDHGPGRVVVRRLGLARETGRQVEREAAVGVLGQPVDLRGTLRIDREVGGRKQRGLLAEADQRVRHGLQGAVRRVRTGALGQQAAGLDQEGVDGAGTRAGDVVARGFDGQGGQAHGVFREISEEWAKAQTRSG